MSVDTVVLLHIIDFFWNMWYFFLWFFDKYKVKKSSICSEYIFKQYKSLLWHLLI